MNLTPLIRIPPLPSLKPRERLLAAGGGIALLILIMDSLVLTPWLRQAEAVTHEIHQMERALKEHHQLLARRDRVFAQLDAYRKYLRPALADELETASLLKEIEDLAAETHVTINEIKPLPIETDPLAKRYPLDIQFECTLETWVDFVIRLESSPSLFQIARAGLAVHEELPDRLQGSLRVVSAAMRPKEAGGHVAREGSHATRRIQ